MATFSEKGYIYKYTNLLNNKVYIGKTKNIENRKYQHEHVTINKKTKFGNALKKYKIINFKFEILKVIISDSILKLDNLLNELESYYIIKYNSYNEGYNLTLGGDGFIGYKHSNETIIKIKQSKQNMSTFTKNKISNSMMGDKNHRFGKSLNTLHKKNLIESRNIKIVQYDKLNNFIKEWDSLSQASKILGIDKGHISNCCKNKRKTAGKFIWKYK